MAEKWYIKTKDGIKKIGEIAFYQLLESGKISPDTLIGRTREGLKHADQWAEYSRPIVDQVKPLSNERGAVEKLPAAHQNATSSESLAPLQFEIEKLTTMTAEQNKLLQHQISLLKNIRSNVTIIGLVIVITFLVLLLAVFTNTFV